LFEIVLLDLQNEIRLMRQNIEEERIKPFVQKKEEGLIRKAASEKVFQENKEHNKSQSIFYMWIKVNI